MRHSSESAQTLASIAGVPAASRWRVVGFYFPDLAEGSVLNGTLLRLHAMSLNSRARVVLVGSRAYVIAADPPPTEAFKAWALRAVAALRQDPERTYSAIGPLMESLEQLGTAREVVDMLMERSDTYDHDDVIVYDTHKSHLAATRIVRCLREGNALSGEPIRAIVANKSIDGQQLLDTLRAVLHGGLDLTATARELHVHPNTLRQRMRTVERVTGLSLATPDDRLVLDLELRAHLHATHASPRGREARQQHRA